MPAFQCAKCQTAHDATDQFCRKCGATLAQEATYTELSGQSEPASDQTVKVIEVTSLTTAEPTSALAPAPKSGLRSLTGAVGSRVSRAIQSEQGKKVVRGATALAVAVGVELLTQATSKTRSVPLARQGKALPPSLNLADSLLRTMEDELANLPEDAMVEEVYIRERTYLRRTIRRRH